MRLLRVIRLQSVVYSGGADENDGSINGPDTSGITATTSQFVQDPDRILDYSASRINDDCCESYRFD